MLRVVYRTVKIIPQYFLSGVLSGVRIIVGYILTEMYVVSVLLIDMRTFPPSMGVLEMHTVSHITMTHHYDVPP